uniref:Uncharacterized protein n=1 Tax=Panagrolaimus sp. PS1159 TaxID=55785 RepID=A0AC35FPE6_9BILA
MNANPKVLVKLMQVSKYFWFKEFPFFVVKDIRYENDKWQYRGIKRSMQCKMCFKTFNDIDLENINKKLWIIESFVIEEHFSPFNDLKLVSSIVPKLAACDITHLCMIGQQISLQEFKLLNAGKIKDFHLNESMITDSNGDILSVENILSFLSKVLSFSYEFHEDAASTLTPQSTKNIIKRLKNSRIKSFTLGNIPETFDIGAFFEFMHENPTKRYYLDFYYLISGRYIQKLQESVDYFIDNYLEDYSAVLINFRDQTHKSYEKLEESWERPF